jgi:hypothetical protein
MSAQMLGLSNLLRPFGPSFKFLNLLLELLSSFQQMLELIFSLS